jgi:hypothetical protein
METVTLQTVEMDQARIYQRCWSSILRWVGGGGQTKDNVILYPHKGQVGATDRRRM